MAKPGEVRQLNELLEAQAERTDPFQSPRMVTARQEGREALGPQTSLGGDPDKISLLQERRQAPQQNLKEFLATRDPQEQAMMLQTEVPQQLQKIGLGELAEGLAFNQMGRLNLMLRLRERFGNDFFENESARNAISIFDQALSKDEQDQEEETASMLSGANRTLEELFRLQGRT